MPKKTMTKKFDKKKFSNWLRQVREEGDKRTNRRRYLIELSENGTITAEQQTELDSLMIEFKKQVQYLSKKLKEICG